MKKKSLKLAAKTFVENVDKIAEFTQRCVGAVSITKEDKIWCYDLAIIRLYREFEELILSCLVAMINNDAATFSEVKQRTFPKHLNVEVCEYLICGDGYFDFAGREGLLKQVSRVVPDQHWLRTIVRDTAYTDSLNQLSALRNFAAHDSAVSKKSALKATGSKKMSSSGSWLQKDGRFDTICECLKKMSQKIEAGAAY